MTAKLNFTRLDRVHGEYPNLDPEDDIVYFGEYAAKKKWNYSEFNSLVYNFKKGLEHKDSDHWYHKNAAIQLVAGAMHKAVNQGSGALFVPIPTSKHRLDPLYDDRILRTLNSFNVFRGGVEDVREVIIQTAATRSSHSTSNRLTIDELLNVYTLDPDLIHGEPQSIVIFDDILTTGTHYAAARRVLKRQWPNAKFYGMFVGRTIWVDELPPVDLTDFLKNLE